MEEGITQGKWIWHSLTEQSDSYAEFYARLVCDDEPIYFTISADSDYALYINGTLVQCGQFADYPWYKSYDCTDISRFIKRGVNHFALVVYHCGEKTQRHYPSSAGVVFEVTSPTKIILVSDENVLSRPSRAYVSGAKKYVTHQLGFSFCYDANHEDEWKTGAVADFSPSRIVTKQVTLTPRPTRKLEFQPFISGKIIKRNGKNDYLFDLGREVVGLLSLDVTATASTTVTVSYGEHIDDGTVRQIIEERDFSVTYVAKSGANSYVNPFLRIACRYLRITADGDIDVKRIGLLPESYAVKEKRVQFANARDGEIYKLCVNTLRLCMMDRYVDCPWREQCLYAFDARNQMLAGYIAFEDGNAAYARAMLTFMAKDRRDDGLLSICFPSTGKTAIPAFSLYYFFAVEEYVCATGDETIIDEVWHKLTTVMQAFISKISGGLIAPFEREKYWNFYDWTSELSGNTRGDDERETDAIINLLTVIALDKMRTLAHKVKKPFDYDEEISLLATTIKSRFYSPQDGLIKFKRLASNYSEIVNALAIIAGVLSGDEAKNACQKIVRGELAPCTLSLKTLVYDALLQVDQKHLAYVLDDIRANYGKMLDNGATSAWETADGASAFDGAGSLCHGWSAIAIKYLDKIKLN